MDRCIHVNETDQTRLVRVFNFFYGALEKKLARLGGMNFLIEKIEPECR